MHKPHKFVFPRAAQLAVVLLALVAAAFLWLRPQEAHGAGGITLQKLQLVRSDTGEPFSFRQPTFVTNAGDGTGRLFVLEQTGQIWIIKGNTVLYPPFLDIHDHVGTWSEGGLLGLAFPKGYAQNGYFFVYYTHVDPNLVPAPPGEENTGNDTVVARFRLKPGDPDQADATSEERLLTANQPFQNHKGGMIAFGPTDGYLYIGTGDGGSAGDPYDHGQSLTTVLGKILRIQVSGTGPYTVPPTNPFASSTNPNTQIIWDYGLRNPWRWSFDRVSGDMMIGDVGQDNWEEVDVHPAGTPGGLNFGWSCYEGFGVYHLNQGCPGPFVDPILSYSHAEANAVTGGYVYRGSAYPNLQGKYIFGDFGKGYIWSITKSGGTWSSNKVLESSSGLGISSFGEDEAGEMYALDYLNGDLYRIQGTGSPPTATPIAPLTQTPVPPPGTPTATPTAVANQDFVLPGTQPGSLVDNIVDPGSCQACHSDPIYKNWRGSMMSQAGRDPLFWSALHVAETDMPGSGEYCLRCHTPKGWFEGRSHPSDGSSLVAKDIEAGVACEVCHRMVSPYPTATAGDQAAQRDAAIRAVLAQAPPTDHVGSAMIILDPEDNRRGPFALEKAPPHPKATWKTDLLGQNSNPVVESSVCGNCHNLDNPALSWDETRKQYWPNAKNAPPPSVAQDALFPIERTFDEWKASTYATAAGVYAPQFAGARPDKIVRTCQDCHMPRATGTAVFDGGVERNCTSTGCLPLHQLVGGNTWVPQLLQNSLWRLNAKSDADALNATTANARAMLQKAATISVSLALTDSGKVATVRVVNETGHKLPTGYAEGQRMWIALQAYDSANKVVYASGVYDPATGELATDPALKVYEIKQGITPELAAQVGQQAGESFHFVLNNTVVKDNRIPPRGYSVAAYNRPGMVPVGTAYADGQYWDETAYIVPSTAVSVTATLYYQLASKEYIDFLRSQGGTDGATLGQLWDGNKSPPEVIAQAEVEVTGSGGQPPRPVDDSVTVRSQGIALIDVLANDADPNNEPLTLVAVQPAVGTATVAGNKIAYTPPAGFGGQTTIKYTVRNSSGLEGRATVKVLVLSNAFLPNVSK